MANETFTLLGGSVSVGGTAYTEARSLRCTMPDIQGVEEIRTTCDNTYLKRTRPEGVCEGTIDFVIEDADMALEFGSPTPNDVTGPITPIDYDWYHPVHGSYFQIRFASAYPNSMEFNNDRDGHLEGTITFQCAKEDTSMDYTI